MLENTEPKKFFIYNILEHSIEKTFESKYKLHEYLKQKFYNPETHEYRVDSTFCTSYVPSKTECISITYAFNKATQSYDPQQTTQIKKTRYRVVFDEEFNVFDYNEILYDLIAQNSFDAKNHKKPHKKKYNKKSTKSHTYTKSDSKKQPR